MNVLPLLASSIAFTGVLRPEGLATAKVVAALVFIGVALAIGIAYRSLRRRLEAEDANLLIEQEFARLDAKEALAPESLSSPEPAAYPTSSKHRVPPARGRLRPGSR